MNCKNSPNYKLTTYLLLAAFIILLGLYIFTCVSMKQERTKLDNQTSSQTMDHSMHDMMIHMTDRMHGKTGDELDRVFLEDMIVHHQGAIDMAEQLLEHTDRPELQTLTTEIIIAQTQEIEQMEQWLDEWFQ